LLIRVCREIICTQNSEFALDLFTWKYFLRYVLYSFSQLRLQHLMAGWSIRGLPDLLDVAFHPFRFVVMDFWHVRSTRRCTARKLWTQRGNFQECCWKVLLPMNLTSLWELPVLLCERRLLIQVITSKSRFQSL
jgi:hypothetical protein